MLHIKILSLLLFSRLIDLLLFKDFHIIFIFYVFADSSNTGQSQCHGRLISCNQKLNTQLDFYSTLQQEEALLTAKTFPSHFMDELPSQKSLFFLWESFAKLRLSFADMIFMNFTHPINPIYILPNSAQAQAQAWGWDGYIFYCHYHPPTHP